MRHGSLFSGIGGFDLASEWMGWENSFHCEWNPFGQKVLKYYWPKAISYHDITKTDFTIHRGAIDILTGGFPCQPYSTAGKRKGKEDERHLWPEMLRAIREIRPRWVVGENVRGLISWNGGLVFEEVQSELEAQGYRVQPFLLPAASVNAPHRRDRIWFVAYTDHEGGCSEPREVSSKDGEVPQRNNHAEPSNSSVQWSSEDPMCSGFLHGKPIEKGTEVWQQRNTSPGGGNGVYLQERDATNTELQGLQGYSNSREVRGEKGEVGGERNQSSTEPTSSNRESVTSNSQSTRQQTCTFGQREEQLGGRNISMGPGQWDWFPTVPPICSRNDGLSDRLDGITFSKWRNESIKAGGNAIVPQVALQIFKAIKEYENRERHSN